MPTTSSAHRKASSRWRRRRSIWRARPNRTGRTRPSAKRGRPPPESHPPEPVPLHIRNAPTGLMKDLGCGEGYRYAFDSENAYLPQEYLPESLRGSVWYKPSDFGYEKTVKERMEWWRELKQRGQ